MALDWDSYVLEPGSANFFHGDQGPDIDDA